jgi:hypothetical protein
MDLRDLLGVHWEGIGRRETKHQHSRYVACELEQPAYQLVPLPFLKIIVRLWNGMMGQLCEPYLRFQRSTSKIPRHNE